MNNKTYQDLLNYLTTLTYPMDYDDKRKTQLRKNSTQYFVKNHTLYRRNKKGNLRVITQDQVEPILFHVHRDITGAHLGIDAVFEKVKERYYWPQIFDDVRNYVRSCDVCQRRGPPERKEPLVPLAVKEPFYQIGIDVKGPLPRTSNGNRYIIVAMDYFTKWPEARAVENMKADTIAKL
jgi:Integrase zinc binding domain